ncbi:hypothetical protein DFP73DRAFT_192690 [Morchella snyderi]|nr:hypothetical protein DFP73DRAFT_192690 [Morchella snyderi]
MDSLQSNLFPDFYQPEYNINQQHHHLQNQNLHPQNYYSNNIYPLHQQENASRFASSLSSGSSSTTSAQASLFPTYTNSTSCLLPSSPPPLPPQSQLPLSLSRRGSACSTSSTGNEVAATAEPEDFPRARLTRDQVLALERQFSETPKPNTKVRRLLAESTGLSTQRVGNWFQNRRAKAKLQKRQEELHTRQILESAGRRRVTEPSSPVSFNPSRSATYYQAGSSNCATTPSTTATANSKPRRTKSTTELPKTPASRFQGSMNSSPYQSPAEASYASLERSLAQAAAATARANSMGGLHDLYGTSAHLYLNESLENSFSQSLDGTQSPWPTSHFSDYGSSNATPLYTPTPAGQLEDPFEYDGLTQSSGASQHSVPHTSAFGQYEYPAEDYAAFAAAIQMNTMSNTFALPSAPPGRFVREKQINPWEEQEPCYQNPMRRDSCPGEFIEAFGSVEIKQEPFALEPIQTESQASLAARRRGPKPTPLGSASLHRRGSVTLPQSAKEPKTAHLSQPATPMRRIKSTGASLNKRGGGVTKGSPPTSPLAFRRLAGYNFHDENYTMDGATIRPRTSGSFSGSSYIPLSQLFSQSGAAPPTPVSPADSEKQDGSGQQAAMEAVAIKFDCSESQMSPPPTPCNNNTVDEEDKELVEDGSEDEDRPEDITPRIGYPASSPSCGSQGLSSIPRDFYGKDTTMVDLFTYSMQSAEEAMLAGGNAAGLFAREDAFPFERYLSKPATARAGENVF